MDIAETPSAVHGHRNGALCVMAHSLGDERAVAAARAWGLHLPAEERRPRRPGVTTTENDELDMVLFVLGKDREQLPLRVFADDRGLLIVASDEAMAVVRPAVKGAGDVRAAIVAITLAVAKRCEEILHRLDDEGQEVEDRARGYSSSPQRRGLGRLRAHLFQIQEGQAAQRDLLAPEEELAQTVGTEHQRLLKRAATAFDANRSLASRLYAMLGDLLNEQDTVVSERLTLVATIFLPLTLATGFFGMNFPWMEDHIGGIGAFIGLGVVLPTALTVLVFMLIRRLTRSS